MIVADPETFWATMNKRETHKNVGWTEADLEEYKSVFFKPETVHAVGVHPDVSFRYTWLT